MSENTELSTAGFQAPASNNALGGGLAVAASREAQQVQAQVVLAKRFPRDEFQAVDKIVKACKRKGLADDALYSYKRGNQVIEAPSIRLAEAVVNYWGNVDAGWQVLSEEPGRSILEAFAWDMESNNRKAVRFPVEHVRWTKKKGKVKLTDPRDIYELCANHASRRLRMCILSVIPSDVVDLAVKQCNKTLKSNLGGPIEDAIRAMVSEFGKIGVSSKMLEGRLEHNLNITTANELAQLRKVFTAIRDGMGKVTDFFTLEGSRGASNQQANPVNDDGLGGIVDDPETPVEPSDPITTNDEETTDPVEKVATEESSQEKPVQSLGEPVAGKKEEPPEPKQDKAKPAEAEKAPESVDAEAYNNCLRVIEDFLLDAKITEKSFLRWASEHGELGENCVVALTMTDIESKWFIKLVNGWSEDTAKAIKSNKPV